MEWVWLALQFVLVYVLSTVLCNIGTVGLARVAGWRVSSCGFGIGKPPLKIRLGTTLLYLTPRWPLRFLALVFQPGWGLSRFQILLSLSGAILTQLSLAFAALLAWWLLPWGATFWAIAAGWNGVRGVLRLIPLELRIGKLRQWNTAGRIRQVLRGQPSFSPPERIRFHAIIRVRAQELGDEVGGCGFAMSATEAWLELGNPTEAERCLAEATPLAAGHGPGRAACFALIRFQLALRRGNPEAVQNAFEQLESAMRTLGDDRAMIRLRWAAAERLIANGEVDRAEALIDELRDLSEAGRERHVELMLTCAKLPLVGPDTLEQWEDEYRATWTRSPELVRELWLGAALARHHEKRGDYEKAEEGYLLAFEAIRQLQEQFSAASDRDSFLEAHKELLEAIKVSAVRAGNRWQLGVIDGMLRTTPEVQAEKQTVEPKATVWGENLSKDVAETLQQADWSNREKSDLRFWKAGWILTCLNVLIGVVTAVGNGVFAAVQTNLANGVTGWAVVEQVFAGREELGWALAVLLASSVGALGWGIGMGLAGRAYPATRRKRGIVLLFLGLMPVFAFLIVILPMFVWHLLTAQKM